MAASEYFNNVFVIEHVFAEGFVSFCYRLVKV